MSLRETILALKLPGPTLVPTPEWEGTDGKIFVRTLTARERLTTIENFSDESTLLDNSIEWVILTACDETGAAIFTTADTAVIGELSSDVIERIMKAIQDKAGITAKVQERLAKNSRGATADDSPSS